MARKTALEQLRESEKQLQTQLRDLRSKIRIAERGENKRIKNTNKYIAKALREIEKTRQATERIQEKELSKLEKFLGESFESLTEARSAFKQQTKKATEREKLAFLTVEKEKLIKSAEKSKSEKQRKRTLKRAEAIEREITGRKLDVNNPSYTVRQLSSKENQAILDFLTDKKTFIDVGNGYLQDGEVITIRIPYHYKGLDGRLHTDYAIGRKLIHNWFELQRYLMMYITEDSTEDWLGGIEVIKMPSSYTAEEHAIIRGRDKDRTRARKKAVKKMFTERESKKRKEFKQKERERSKARETKLKQQNKELKKQLKGRK